MKIYYLCKKLEKKKTHLKSFCEYMYFKTSSIASINIFRRWKAPLDAECCHFKALLYNNYRKNRLYIAGGCRITCCNTSATNPLLRNVIKYTPCTIIDTINNITKPILVIITISKAMEASNWLTYTSQWLWPLSTTTLRRVLRWPYLALHTECICLC